MFLNPIAKILNVKEKELEKKLIAPDSMIDGWYDQIIISSPFTKPAKELIEEWVVKFEEFDSVMIDINKDPMIAMAKDNGKKWSNYILFLQSLSIDEIDKVKEIAAKTKVEVDDRAAKKIVSDGKLKYLRRLSFSSEIIALVAYLNEAKPLTDAQYLEQATLLSPIKEALTNAMTVHARAMVEEIVPDEVLVTTSDRVAILNEIDNFLTGE